MKKNYILLFALFASLFSIGQTVTITRVVDGGLPSDGCSGSSGTSSPKAIELYVDGTVDFTGYTYDLEANGGTISYQTTDLTSFGSISDQFVYIICLGETTFDEIVPGATKIVTGSGTFNGDDYIRITDGTNLLDEFGVLGTDGTGEPWEYLDTYASRNDGISANTTFTLSEWTFGTVNQFDGTDCSTLSSAVGFGNYDSTASTEAFEKNNFSIYPNPTNTGSVNIKTTSSEAVSVSVFNILGKQVINTTLSNNTLDVSNLNTGVYILRLSQNGSTTTKKLVIN